MKLKCPDHPNNFRFHTTVPVFQEMLVNNRGDIQEILYGVTPELIEQPKEFRCVECGRTINPKDSGQLELPSVSE